MSDIVKVLVVDDAAFMRKAVTNILEKDAGIRVVGTAKNGLDCLKKIMELRPDVITLDMDMPVMDGLTSIRHLMIKSPVPVVVLSSLFDDGEITFEAVRLGVVDFVPKPSGAISTNINNSTQLIINRTKLAQSVNLENIRRVRIPKWSVEDHLTDRYGYRPLDYIIPIGTSLTGPNTIIRFIAGLSPALPAAVVVVQEISPKIVSSFVKRFDQLVQWKIIEAKDNMIVEQGACYLCSNLQTWTMQVNEHGEVCLKKGETTEDPLNHLFTSAALLFQRHTIGILLSGLGNDGAEGLAHIRQRDGLTIAQDIKCCVYPNLTENAIEKQVVDIVLNEKELPKTVAETIYSQETQ